MRCIRLEDPRNHLMTLGDFGVRVRVKINCIWRIYASKPVFPLANGLLGLKVTLGLCTPHSFLISQ